MYYTNTIKHELNTAKRFEHNSIDVTSVVDTHRCHMTAKFEVFLRGTIASFIRNTGCLSFTNDPLKVRKGAKIRNQYNQVPHLTQDTNRKVTNSQLDVTNKSQEVSPSPAGDHKAHINRRTQRHSKHKTENT